VTLVIGAKPSGLSGESTFDALFVAVLAAVYMLPSIIVTMRRCRRV
jgi:hypothetical protein